MFGILESKSSAVFIRQHSLTYLSASISLPITSRKLCLNNATRFLKNVVYIYINEDARIQIYSLCLRF